MTDNIVNDYLGIIIDSLQMLFHPRHNFLSVVKIIGAYARDRKSCLT
jgi:hypothetical protein